MPKEKRGRKRTQNIKNKKPDTTNKPMIIHHMSSKMMYDGTNNSLMVETQKDNEPIKRRRYTLRQMRRENPLGAMLIRKYLKGKIPKHIHEPVSHAVRIHPVLPNSEDLGLLPPTPHVEAYKNHLDNHRKRKYNIVNNGTVALAGNHSHDVYDGDSDGITLDIHENHKPKKYIYELP